MMKLKKIGAIVLAVMMMAVAATAWASSTEVELEENGEAGVAGDWNNPDEEREMARKVIIKKELIAFNANSTAVHAPAFTYVYDVTQPTLSDLSVTDEGGDHLSGATVIAPIKPGITQNLVVKTATHTGDAGNQTQASGMLEFTNTDMLNTSANGTTNEYDIVLDFTNVVFEQPGVYRYQIHERLGFEKTYDGIAVQDGGSNYRYLDVYVDGAGKIYGYVCMSDNTSVTPDTDTKTNGFVEETGTSPEGGTSGDAYSGADYYYTYDLTLDKDVVSDNYAESNIAFPFTVIFNNTENYDTTYTIEETAGNGSTGINPAAASAPTWKGVALVKDGGSSNDGKITYTGIPVGVDVDVYETNIATGVTYTVVTKVNDAEIASGQDNNVISGQTPSTAAAQPSRAAYESTKATVDTTLVTKVDATQTVEIINTLLLVSPTGIVLRFAPYALILVGGIALLLIAKKHKKHTEEE